MSYDPIDIQAEQTRVQEEADRTQRARQGEEADWSWLMSSKRGRRVVWRWLERSGVFEQSMTGNSYTFYNEGKRSNGIALNAFVLDNCPKDYALMLEEKRDYNK